jgi:hypothetical protein
MIDYLCLTAKVFKDILRVPLVYGLITLLLENLGLNGDLVGLEQSKKSICFFISGVPLVSVVIKLS